MGWLDDNKKAYSFTDVKEDGITKKQVAALVEGGGRLGEAHQPRRLYVARPSCCRDEGSHRGKAVALATANPSLIRRPLIEYGDGTVTVGFSDKVRGFIG